MRIVKFYTYDSQPWRYGVVQKEERCSHTGDTHIWILSENGGRRCWDLAKIKVEEVLNIEDSDLGILYNLIERGAR